MHLRYAVLALVCATSALRADDWPRWLGPQRDSVWRESGILKAFPAEGPTVRWRAPIGNGYSGPAVADGRVYVIDRKLAEAGSNPSNPFDRGRIPGTERVVCLNEADGKQLWVHEYECPYTVSYAAGPRTTPVVSGGKVYTLGAEG
ncbi:MAG: pyrrolo-quinoline quinone, partial [Verrucomicrobiaceae bacterium]